ncbi:gamma-glutamylcyclotransferase family protein [Chloroflexota bacterium]
MYYFTYASNLNKKQMRERASESKPMFVATLPNYRIAFAGWSRRWRGGYATIVLSRGDGVLGAVYEVSEKDLRRLDSYEDCPRSYNRINVTVFDEDGNVIEVVTYIKAGRIEETQPSKEYLTVIQQGYRDWGLFK